MIDKHTPGPWIAENGMVYALDETGRVNRFSVLVQGGYSSAPVYGDRIRTTPEELAVNARLIAAAPDLLAALRAAMHVLEHRDSDWFDPRKLYRLHDQTVRVTIATETPT